LKQVLNAGSGVAGGSTLHPAFRRAEWEELRLDVDANVSPDIVGSFTAMQGLVADASVDAIWSSHSIEHLHTHEVGPALREFRRVLRADGFALVTCPDLRAIARLLLEADAETIAYQSSAGPIRVLDMIYGHAHSIAAGRLAMTHNTGFTVQRLGRVAADAGFVETRVVEGDGYDLWALLMMPEASLAAIAEIFAATNIARLFDFPPAASATFELAETNAI
jgi:SAM-dependent methyltransferase